jgi:hypothetical protein
MSEDPAIMHRAKSLITGGRTALLLALALALGACAKIKPDDPQATATTRSETKRHHKACASSVAYARLKGILFDRAIAQHDGDRSNLDTLADYSFARMEDPVVTGWDPALDITRCRGRFILQMPPGAERGFGGAQQLQEVLDYTAQSAADGSGFVYQMNGAETIVTKLAAFNLTSRAYRPSPAIDEGEAEAELPALPEIAQADVRAPLPQAQAQAALAAWPRAVPPARPSTFASGQARTEVAPEPNETLPVGGSNASGEATIRAFYDALHAGDGEAASAQIVPEKQASPAFAPHAISRFYGRLPEPIRLTRIEALASGAYRVSYRYSAGRSRCDGNAVVSLTRRNGRALIRSIRALSGC